MCAIVPYTYPDLSTRSSSTSPFTIIFKEVGSTVAACESSFSHSDIHALNGFFRSVHERRYSHFRTLSWKPRVIRWYTSPLRSFGHFASSGSSLLLTDDEERCPSTCFTRYEFDQFALLWKQLYRSRSVVGVVTKSCWCLQPGAWFRCQMREDEPTDFESRLHGSRLDWRVGGLEKLGFSRDVL